MELTPTIPGREPQIDRPHVPALPVRAEDSHRTVLGEIRENEFNLNIPRYVDTSEEEEEIDVATLQTAIDRLEAELARTRQ